jgi:hypothetical protein
MSSDSNAEDEEFMESEETKNLKTLVDAAKISVREAWEKNKSGAKSGPAQQKKWLEAVDFGI